MIHPRKNSESRLVRVLQLHTLLQSNGGSTKWLAEELGVSRRTIFRDLSLIRDSGLAIKYDKERSCHYFSSPTPTKSITYEFSTEDLSCLLFAANTSPAISCSAVRKAVTRAMAHLSRGVCPDSQMQQRRISAQVLLKGQGELSRQGQLAADIIIRSLTHSTCVRVVIHVQGNGVVLHTKLSPYCLSISGSTWTVTGRSSRCCRTVHVDINHIATIDELSETFELPVGFVDKWQERGADYPQRAPRY